MRRIVCATFFLNLSSHAMETSQPADSIHDFEKQISQHLDLSQETNKWLLEKITQETGITFTPGIIYQLSDDKKTQLAALLSRRNQVIDHENKPDKEDAPPLQNHDIKLLYQLILEASNKSTEFANKSFQQQMQLNKIQSESLKQQRALVTAYKKQARCGMIGTTLSIISMVAGWAWAGYQYYADHEGSKQ